jgi:hypothetical protein
MKNIVDRLFIVILFVASPSLLKGQIKTCGYFNGYWGPWEEHYFMDIYGRIDETLLCQKVYGNYSGFCIYQGQLHPSYYSFKFQITNYVEPSKKIKKEHLKSKQWYEYSGIVEYYVTDKCPTAKAAVMSCIGNFPCILPTAEGAKKRTANARIKIEPYKDHPKVYNIWFEDVGVGIDLGFITFNL